MQRATRFPVTERRGRLLLISSPVVVIPDSSITKGAVDVHTVGEDTSEEEMTEKGKNNPTDSRHNRLKLGQLSAVWLLSS